MASARLVPRRTGLLSTDTSNHSRCAKSTFTAEGFFQLFCLVPGTNGPLEFINLILPRAMFHKFAGQGAHTKPHVKSSFVASWTKLERYALTVSVSASVIT
jgi:hypothetical protein